MRVDGRKLSHEKLEEIRIEAVRRVQSGEAPTAVARSMGLYTNRIFIWLAAYRNGGWQALRARKAMGRPKRLNANLASVGRLLAQLGLTCQRPLFRAYQQDRSQVDRWLKDEYPKIRAQAMREKAEIFFEVSHRPFGRP